MEGGAARRDVNRLPNARGTERPRRRDRRSHKEVVAALLVADGASLTVDEIAEKVGEKRIRIELALQDTQQQSLVEWFSDHYQGAKCYEFTDLGRDFALNKSPRCRGLPKVTQVPSLTQAFMLHGQHLAGSQRPLLA